MKSISALNTNYLKIGLFSVSVILFLGVPIIFAQEKSFGDESVKNQIKKKTTDIYKNHDKIKFFLIKNLPRIKTTCGIEITAFSEKNKINRLVAKTCRKQGKQATEFYFEQEKLMYVYKVFEVFEGKATLGLWKNFKGLLGWESRFYFVNQRLKFHSHKGRNMISREAEESSIKNYVLTILKHIQNRE